MRLLYARCCEESGIGLTVGESSQYFFVIFVLYSFVDFVVMHLTTKSTKEYSTIYTREALKSTNETIINAYYYYKTKKHPYRVLLINK